MEIDCEELIFPNGTATTCYSYDYTSGNIIMDGGTFTANDLVDNGIFGTIIINGGELNFHQGTDQYVDINCELDINGGTFNIYGGMDDSYWAYANSAEIHMIGGILDFKDVGIRIYNTHSIGFDVIEGVVRTTSNLYCYRPDFNPSNGTFELYGISQSTLNCVAGASFFDINVNKNAAAKVTGKSYNLTNPRNPEDTIKNPKANDVLLTSNLHLSGNLNIFSGSLNINGYNLEIDNDLNIDDMLVMNNSSDLVRVHGDIYWNQNSTTNVTEGLILLEGDFNVLTGANVLFGINNTLKFYGNEISEIANNGSGTSLGNLVFDKTNNHTILNPSSYALAVNDGILVSSDNEVRFSGLTVNCNGTIFGGENCQMILDNNATIESNGVLSLVGNLTLNSGTLICHDLVQTNSSAIIQINGGSCIWDRPFSSSYFHILGEVIMNDGVFEVTNDGIDLGPVADFNQDGGDLKIGWGLKAENEGNFQATDGTVEFIGPTSSLLQFEVSNYIYDLVINKTSTGKVNNIDNLNIINNVSVNNNELNIGSNDFTIGGNLMIEPTGILNATNGDIYIGGDWVNYAGEDGFLEGTRLVRFEGNGNSHILTNETFYNLVAQINGGSYDYLWADPNTTINILGDLEINSCSFRLDANATLNIQGDLVINENTNLFASSSADTYINLEGNWINHNTTGYPWANGFYYGLSTVNYTGDDDAWVQADCGVQEFYNLKISLGTAEFFPFSDITVHNDATIFGGSWAQDDIGMTFTFMGNIDIDIQGAVNDYANIFVMAGEGEQHFTNGSGTIANIGNLSLNMSSAGGGSIPPFWLTGNLHCYGNITVDTGDFIINSNSLECVGNFNINENGKVTASGSSVIAMGSGSALNVNGGQLALYGNGINNPKVTAISGNYEFNVMNSGTLATAHATFEYMDDGGVNVYTSGLLYGTNAFSNCTFKNGIADGSLLQINNDQDLVINGAEFPENTWGGAYNVRKTTNQGTVNFTNITGDFAGPAYENDPYNRIGWDDLVPGIWEGTVSHSWNDPNNWENNLKPTALDDAYIPDGTPNDPWVATTDQFCNNLTIEAGASLRIYDEILTVYGNMIIYGELVMDHTAGVLNVGDFYGEMISWESGSTDNITSGTINVFGDWYFKYGTNAQLGAGNTVNFHGNNLSNIYCDSPIAKFGNIEINKTATPKDFVYLKSGNELRVSQDISIYDGILDIEANCELYIGNELNVLNGGTLRTIAMAGNESIISGFPNYCTLVF